MKLKYKGGLIKMKGNIYKITNDINNKVYIGKTLLTIEERFSQHCKDALKPSKEKRPLYSAMRKYGIEHFSISLVEEVSLEELNNREIYWINQFNSFHFGYNATLGGEGKQKYDYNEIVQGFLSGKLIKELAEEYGCCVDTISKALKLAHINAFQNSTTKSSKKIVAKDLKTNEILYSFESETKAAKWLLDNNIAKGKIDNVVAAIGRVANGKRASAYKMKWERN